MAVLKPKYDANYDALTLTSLAGLAIDSWWQSNVIDNGTDLFMDVLVGGSIQSGTTPTDGTSIDVFTYGAINTSDYGQGASGSVGTYTTDGQERNLRYLGTIVVDGTSNQDWEFGPWSVAEAFGGTMPQKWGIILHNRTGAALNATGTNNAIRVHGVQFDIV